MRHYDLFKQIYREITGRDPVPVGEEDYKQPESYLAGIEQALFGELAAVELYRQIYYGLRKREHRDKLFEIITDELKHSGKYNFIYTRNYTG
ncbi:ferritin-like domain-containing protein [Sporohalobacter salinus]|uniref:ferritin-like domain-containing protein n=1 Tax=Sporohalobacter salinus TaxID=1494606 RepID=UPI001960762E|nr:ferritin-like domain-containing protein [Sporohalobacter salinus]MBM7624473.1 rubrerythrin [Sporohalobacter salinus]